LSRKLIVPTLVGLFTGAALWILGVRHVMTLFTFALAAFAIVLLVGEWVRPALARSRSHGESLPRALATVPLKSRRRYGGYVVHLGVVIVAIGIAGSSAYKKEIEATLRPGETLVFDRYSLQFDSLWAIREPHRDVVGATVSVSAAGRALGDFVPRLNYYPNSDTPILTPAVRYALREDLYLTLMAYAQDGSTATLKAFISPLVSWIWIGGLVIGLGALFALWPGGKAPAEAPLERARARPAEATAGAGADRP
jgi:cytochrome c-type biogenesis protein CcmF